MRFTRGQIRDLRGFVEWFVRGHGKMLKLEIEAVSSPSPHLRVDVVQLGGGGQRITTVTSYDAVDAPLTRYAPHPSWSGRGLDIPSFSGDELLFYEADRHFWIHHRRRNPRPVELSPQEVVALDEFLDTEGMEDAESVEIETAGLIGQARLTVYLGPAGPWVTTEELWMDRKPPRRTRPFAVYIARNGVGFFDYVP